MKKNIEIPESISSRVEYKRKFILSEMYRAFVFVPAALVKMIDNKINKSLDNNFVERLQLAVTEVNECVACSYAHTAIALKQGMSNEEIYCFLSGDDKFIKPEEARAILFAQHFADTRGYPDRAAFDLVVKEYGEKNASIILAAIQLMMVGNIYGIPYSAFHSRLKGKPYKDSSVFYETGMLIAGLLISPIALAHAVFKGLFGISNKRLYNRIA